MYGYLVVGLIVVIGLIISYNRFQFAKAEKMYPPKGEFITVDGCRLHFIKKGEGHPVVFLHGGILSSRDFERIVELAAGKGFMAIAFDRPGYGFSERPKSEVTPIQQARMLHSAIKTLGVDEPVIIVAHSWSGSMSLSYANQFPEDVRGVITLGAALYKEGYPAENGDPLSKLVKTPILGKLIMNTMLKSPLGKGMAGAMVKETFKPEVPPEGYIEEVYALAFRPRHFAANREDVLAFPTATKEISEDYNSLQHPVLILVGEDDPFGTIEHAERLNEELPQSDLRILPKVAHMIPDVHPELVVQNVVEFHKCLSSRISAATKN
ncbi:alpha/beta fold hydrolase [Thalassobacillus hwangdonensis]|uniref:Alpha/beta fold hydrolase n=1 Tax=Thalassobacillus hwangdonensis TaxID=546108 RepID=A0ABW3L2R2_9BACI